MKNAALIALGALTVLVALSAASETRAQRTPPFQRPTITEQARLRERVPVGASRARASQSNTAVAPARSIFQATPAQLSPARPTIAGQRQTAASLVPANGPLERINGRIETRVQSRIVNRLDKSGEAPPTLSPFATAADRARVALTRRR